MDTHQLALEVVESLKDKVKFIWDEKKKLWDLPDRSVLYQMISLHIEDRPDINNYVKNVIMTELKKMFALKLIFCFLMIIIGGHSLNFPILVTGKLIKRIWDNSPANVTTVRISNWIIVGTTLN